MRRSACVFLLLILLQLILYINTLGQRDRYYPRPHPIEERLVVQDNHRWTLGFRGFWVVVDPWLWGPTVRWICFMCLFGMIKKEQKRYQRFITLKLCSSSQTKQRTSPSYLLYQNKRRRAIFSGTSQFLEGYGSRGCNLLVHCRCEVPGRSLFYSDEDMIID